MLQRWVFGTQNRLLTSFQTFEFVFSLNLANSVTKMFRSKKIIRTCNLSCKRLWCYHRANNTQVTDIILKLSPNHTPMILQITRMLLHLGKTPISSTTMVLLHLPAVINEIYTKRLWKTFPNLIHNKFQLLPLDDFSLTHSNQELSQSCVTHAKPWKHFHKDFFLLINLEQY